MRWYCFRCREFVERSGARGTLSRCTACGKPVYSVASAERTQNIAETALPILVRGAAFERQDREEWLAIDAIGGVFLPELRLPLGGGRFGRIDVGVHLDDDDGLVIVELKSTRWELLAPHRVRPNLQRHVRQLMTYVDAAFRELDLYPHPSLTYPTAPEEPLKTMIEEFLLGHVTQCVWRDDESFRATAGVARHR